MTMRVLLLTTDTVHHKYFAVGLADSGHRVHTVLESPSSQNDAFSSPFRRSQTEFEESQWSSAALFAWSNIGPVRAVESLNSQAGVDAMTSASVDVAVTFGTSRLTPASLSSLPAFRWNLHGGDPRRYRGLDSHLWAVYHGDFDALVTTLHWLVPALDRGPIVAGRGIDVSGVPELHMLRAANTDLALSLTLGSLAHLESVGDVSQLDQDQVGRYYSGFPSSLMPGIVKKFKSFRREI